MDVRPLSPGALISEPGVYSMSLERYHGQCCIGPSVSSSGLRDIFGDSPKHFWVHSSLNPDAIDRPVTKAMTLGRAAHHYLLGEADFHSTFATLPDKYPDFRTDAAKRWRGQAVAEGKEILKPEDLDKIRAIATALAEHPLVQAGALNGHIERSLIYQDKETGLWVKARPDVIPNDSGDFVDVKITASVEDDKLQRSIFEYGYHQQADVVQRAAHALGLPFESFTLFFIEAEQPHDIWPRTLGKGDLDLGHRCNRVAMKMLARCLETGSWPGRSGTIRDAAWIGFSPWQKTRAENRIAELEQELQG